MKIHIDATVDDFVTYLKERGKIKNEILEDIQILNTEAKTLRFTFEENNEVVPLVEETPLQKVLNEKLQNFFLRKEAPVRMDQFWYGFPDYFKNTDSRFYGLDNYDIKQLITVEEFLQISERSLLSSHFRNVGKMTIAQLRMLFEEEGIPNTYPFMIRTK